MAISFNINPDGVQRVTEEASRPEEPHWTEQERVWSEIMENQAVSRGTNRLVDSVRQSASERARAISERYQFTPPTNDIRIHQNPETGLYYVEGDTNRGAINIPTEDPPNMEANAARMVELESQEVNRITGRPTTIAGLAAAGAGIGVTAGAPTHRIAWDNLRANISPLDVVNNEVRTELRNGRIIRSMSYSPPNAGPGVTRNDPTREYHNFFTQNTSDYPRPTSPVVEVPHFPFNLERALDGDAVILKSGESVKQVFLFIFNREDVPYQRYLHPLIAYSHGEPRWYKVDGTCEDPSFHLFMKHEKQEDGFL
jgi:hypothetical protein